MFDFIKKIGSGTGLPEVLIRDFTPSILIGLKQVHDHGFVHCNIKPHNVLLVPIVDGYIPKVVDFGLVKRHNVRDGSGVRGTHLFFSPEMVVFGIQEAPSDIWALGYTMLMMLTGKPPWSCTSKSELVSQIAMETPTIPRHISKASQNFLSCCFVRHSVKRLTATKLLSHFFLLESNECKEVFIQESVEVSN
ncbi:mitogen-activated protein kinase kinase kinase 20-like [Quercus robur]|uniref:mitogen-activated protein kinase kinase kinase 20-like n=1 Tax=Quercus robur TaxID=38942 RepID=UPI002161F73C|nr:mitogen-activated protein kinase kinase kinase 20-like [Quercus robur]